MRVGVLAALIVLLAAPAAKADTTAPGAPGQVANWAPGNKEGFGTSTTIAGKAWFTLQGGELSEVYAPDLGTPSLRDLQFVVSDGKTFTERETDVQHKTELVDQRSLTYRQVSTASRWKLTKTYVVDPERSAVLVDVTFESRTPLDLYVLADPALSGSGDDDRGKDMTAWDAKTASAIVADPPLTRSSSGYMGASDGWTDLQSDHRMDWTYEARDPGNVVQLAATRLDGVKRRHLTLAVAFGATPPGAANSAAASLRTPFSTVAKRYAQGWHDYLGKLRRPRSAQNLAPLYDASVMTLAATEDKTYRGALVASPSMPWVWGNIAGYNGPYHLVWSRDAYEVATGLLAAGDRAAANRALDYLFTRQQKPDGCFPQNSNLDGTPHWPNLQLDEVADPIMLAWQLGRTDAATYAHVKQAAQCILANGPASQERWENATGYSPATIGAEIAGLICAAAIADRNGDAGSAATYRATADDFHSHLERWTVTHNGPLSPDPYFVRLTVDGNADAGTTYTIGDGGPTIDQRAVVDPSFLELVRLGVLPADDPAVKSTLPVVDRELGVNTPNGQFWHRFNYDGYGERPDGSRFDGPGNRGRLWPIFAGERGEYELSAGDPHAAAQRLQAMANTANSGRMLPEQVWDDHPPAPAPGFQPGTPTFSATPLGWTHAQLIRLAWSIDAGKPVEQPAIVAERYAR
jgi:glucoamylase